MNRKQPIVLATAIAVMVCAAIAYNVATAPKNANSHDHSDDKQDLATRNVSEQEVRDLRDKMNRSLGTKKPVQREGGGAIPFDEPNYEANNTPKPTILLAESVKAVPPVPNENQIATQWYRDESRSAGQSK